MRFPSLLTFTFTTTLAATVFLSACKREHRVPTVTQVTGDVVPSSDDITKEKYDQLVAELYDLPPLGTGVLFKTPDDETWDRYPCGILIHDLKPSQGTVPKIGQTVSIVYTGTFPADKKMFDQNSKDSPLIFRLGSKTIIKGLSMGLSTMHAGGKRRIFVPADLAYGAEGQRGRIPANQALIFEVELLSVTGDPVELPKAVIPVDEAAGPPLPKPAATQPDAGGKP